MPKNKTLERKDFMLVKIEEMNKEEILVVSSRDVAEDFGKEHKDILESIRNLTAENSAVKNIKEVEQLEMLVSSLIGLGMGYEEIKTFIEQRYQPTMLSA